jgi:glutathione S-transferase
MTVKLYTNPGSHPCAAAEAALALKSIEYDRIDLMWPSQALIGRLRYGGKTVPGMRLDGERLVGSREIIHRLDSVVAEPALLPAPDDPKYEAVLDAERWGDEVLQGVARRVIDVALLSRPAAMESYLGDAKLPLPRALLRPGFGLTARWMASRNKARDEAVQADLAELREHLDRIDAWIADGLLGGVRPNAADLQIGSSIRLLMTIGDVRPMIEGRPAAGLTRYFPPMVGEVDAGALPAEWLSVAARRIDR